MSSLHHTLLTLLPPRSPFDFTSRRVHGTWLGLMPWPCWCPAHSSSLPPSAWWITEVRIVVHADYQLFIHWHSGHMTSIVLSILERDPPLLLSWRFLPFICPVKDFFLFLGSCSWSDVRSKVRDVYVYRLLSPLRLICDIGRYKIN